MIVGFDYAEVDGNLPPDLGAFKRACLEAGSTAGVAVIRGTWGMHPDPVFSRDFIRCVDAGLTCGTYMFLRTPRNGFSATPEDQVHCFFDYVGPLSTSHLPPVIDVEEVWHTEPDHRRAAELELAWVHRAWTALRDAYGVPPIIYDSGRVWAEDLDDLPAGEMLDAPQWVAKPWPWKIRTPARLAPGAFASGKYDPIVPTPWGPGNWWMHQYQGDAYPVPGFTSTVDLSRFHLLQEGQAGVRVEWVQRRLGMVATGTFDAAMASRIRAFQHAQGLSPDAVIGPKTFAKICWSGGVERPVP